MAHLALAAGLRTGPSRVRPSRVRPDQMRRRCTVVHAAHIGLDTPVTATRRQHLGLLGLAVATGPAWFAARSNAAEPEGPSAALPEVTTKVFFDFTADDVPLGRIVIGLYGKGPAPIGAARFRDLAVGAMGVGYRKRPVDYVSDEYIRHCGVRTFNRGEFDSSSLFAGGDSAVLLQPELERPSRLRHTGSGEVSLVVRRPPGEEQRTKERLVARGGKLITVVEKLGKPDPNGSAWIISLAGAAGAPPDAAVLHDLDATSLVVGRLLEGAEVIRAIQAIPIFEPSNAENGYFKVAKAIGDARATITEAALGRPLKIVDVVACGELE